MTFHVTSANELAQYSITSVKNVQVIVVQNIRFSIRCIVDLFSLWMHGLYFVSDETQNSHQLNGEGKIVKSILNATLSIKISSFCQKRHLK